MDPRLAALRDALPGQVLRGSGRVVYHLRQCIGEGGQGWVFTANWDDPHGAVVIVKVLRPDAVNADAMRRFQREAEVLRMLSQQGAPNPHIVRFYDHAIAPVTSKTGETLELPFTVLEYVHGVTLERVIAESRGGLALDRARRILRQVAQALEIVHGQRIIHRDLKPSNILLATEAGAEVAKVTDFGLVKLVDVALQRTATLAGASLGYAPPEQYEMGNKRVSERTDVFSLAAIAFEMLTGKPAFPFVDGENPLLIVTRIMNGPRPSLLRAEAKLAPELRARKDLAAALDAQIQRALSPDPNDRHESILALWRALEPNLKTPSTAPESTSLPPKSIQFSETVPANVERPRTPPPPRSLGASLRGPYSQVVMSRAPASDLSTPAQWSWNVVVRPVQPNLLRGAVFTQENAILGVGPSCGVARCDGGRWTTLPSAGLPTRAVRGVRALMTGDLLLFGDGGFAATLAPSGHVTPLPIPETEAAWMGGWVDPHEDIVILVGERLAGGGVMRTTSTDRVGWVAQYTGSRLAWCGDTSPSGRLNAVARLGNAWVAVGNRGALVKIGKGSAEYVRPACAGDLLAAATLPNGHVLTVGVGGHALHIGPHLETQLEAVQTTRDLVSVAVSDEGVAWAGAPARVLRRTVDSWVRMSGELGLHSTVIAISARGSFVRAVCDDGAVLEGRLAG